MKTIWRALAALALVAPMGAYVAGSLVASAADDPSPRPAILIEDASPSTPPSTDLTPSSSPSSSPAEVDAVELDPDDIDDWGRDDDHRGGPWGDDSDHGGDDRGNDDRGSDDRGSDDHGGGHSGHGGGDDD